MKIILAFPGSGKTEASKVIPGLVDLDFGFYREAHGVPKDQEETLLPSFAALVAAYVEQGHVVLTNEPKLLQYLPSELRAQSVMVLPHDLSFAAVKLQPSEDVLHKWLSDWAQLAQESDVPVVYLGVSLLTALCSPDILDTPLTGGLLGPVSVPPKPSKKQVPEEQYLDVLLGHHQAVQDLLTRAALILLEHGATHDMDKIENWRQGIRHPAEPHHLTQAHHAFHKGNEQYPDLFDIIEVCVDTVTTTAGKQSLDPWVVQWTPPLQDPRWWQDVILRTCLRLND